MAQHDELDKFSDAPLTPYERARVRRMLFEDAYARRLKIMVRVWVISFGAIMSAMVAIKVLLGDLIVRLLKL